MRHDSERESVRRHYAELATAAATGGSCCTTDELEVFGAAQYGAGNLG